MIILKGVLGGSSQFILKYLIAPMVDICHNLFDLIFMIINHFHDVDILFGRLRVLFHDNSCTVNSER